MALKHNKTRKAKIVCMFSFNLLKVGFRDLLIAFADYTPPVIAMTSYKLSSITLIRSAMILTELSIRIKRGH